MPRIQCFMVVQSDDKKSFRRTDTGEVFSFRDLPPGAMYLTEYDYWCYHGMGRGPDGKSLIVRTPGGTWNVDSRCSNCTMPDDNEHRCWVRHGEPPNVTVSKEGGLTCQAGAGSIQCGNYHGFLRNGFLED